MQDYNLYRDTNKKGEADINKVVPFGVFKGKNGKADAIAALKQNAKIQYKMLRKHGLKITYKEVEQMFHIYNGKKKIRIR